MYAYYAELGAGFASEEERAGMLGPVTVRREPVGVVAAIVPWNVPQFIIALKLAPALVAGCTVVIKPAPETPLDAYPLAEMLDEAGVPKGVVSIVAAGRETGEHLVRHPGVDKVAFTGSTDGGPQDRRDLRRAAEALHPGARRQVRRDHPRRRRPRRHDGLAQARLADEQRPGLRRADPHPGLARALRRGGRTR